MSLVRRVARPMVATMFVMGGIESLRNPQGPAQKAGPVATKIAEKLPVQLPTEPVDLVRIDAGVKVGAGLMFAMGRLPRLSALALAATLVPTTFAGHPFWTEKDPSARAAQQIHFFKNVSMLGGLLLAAVDTEGRPSLGWRARRAAAGASKETRRSARRARKQAGRRAGQVKKIAS